MIIPQDLTGARVQALTMTIGLFTFVSVGVAACIALVIGLFYLVVGLVMVVLQAITEVFATIATTWASADPFLRVVLLAAIAYGGYRLYRERIAKGGK